MGLIKAALGAAGGVLADQWLEFFYCDSLAENVMAVKGQKRASGRSSNTSGEENIISNGSGIAVADGQCMIIVEQGKVLDFCAEPGQYTFNAGGEPSLFTGGDLGQNAIASLKSVFERFKYGGSPGKDTRVYYFNTKELIGNKYGTPSPVPFRVVDQNIGLDIDISIRCFGEYSYRIVNPMLFYTNVCGNVSAQYTRDKIDGQLKTELMTALQPAFAKISAMGIRYSMLPGHTVELAEALNEVLSSKWRDLRGLEIVSLGVSSVKASDEDENMIKELQRNATFRNPTMAAAHLVGAQAAAMQSAASNEGAGSAMAFMGMNMAGSAGGMNAQNLFQMGQQAPQQQTHASAAAPAPNNAGWVCACGHAGNTGKFCMECGKPQSADGWTCACGALNKGKFCAECGGKKPAGVPQYKCDKCGWEPQDKTRPPKFCPECGDLFDDGDII
ncbi:MAG TPA: virion core protein (lumpy skin disease virus) [Ruminococcaceae bacterium]|nr:virion core protein (lumpy skin disease virus) [Oscillospiraceae bacterium]